ncbi:uncharacterized protein LOC108118316 [Drosophila eugracilis]|uniref:uncharacterized protein LOC108118316 n=1 Tax=Drosophila eugracilis TaxID=29029 RepID=UPI001BDACDC4|nr:uncharacterized protein LOC108118316 [Drosophila eugracilis]
MYSIGHKIDGKFLTLYDVCYDTTALRARFSQARIYPKKINLPRPLDKLFSPSPVMSPFHANSFFKGEIYDRFKKIYGERQNYVANGAEVINRGHLTASSDFLFEDQLSSTYKLVNVVPQFASINSGNWNIIESGAST